MQDTNKSKQTTLSTRLKLLYGAGDLSTSIPQAVLMFFQLYFLTDVARLRPDYAAWAIAAGRVWDSINDPLFGVLSDRIQSRFGRRRVLLLAGAIPLGVAFMLMWIVPPLSQAGLTLYYALIFIIFDTAYTAVHVGYNSLTPNLTMDYDERSSVNGYRMFYSIGGSLGSIVLATVLGWYITDNRLLFTLIGTVLGSICIIPPFIVFRITQGHKQPPEKNPISIQEAIKTTLENRPFWMVMGLYLLSWTTFSITAAVLIYYANYYLGVPEQANYFVLLAQGLAILFIPVTVQLSQRLDKRRAFIIGEGSWVIILLSFLFIKPGDLVLAYVMAGSCSLGIATAYVIPWAMIPDIIEHDEVQTGQRREGSYYAFASFFQKLGTGAALWLMGQVFALVGYVTPTAAVPIPAQPSEAILAIRIFISVIPAVLLLLSLVFAWKYPISREMHQSLVQELATREI